MKLTIPPESPEAALRKHGWVSNRFKLVEERLARLEERDDGAWDRVGVRDWDALGDEPMNVAKLRADLAGFDPATPIEVEVDDDLSAGEVKIWSGQTLIDAESTPQRAIYSRKVILMVGTTEAGDQETG